MKKHKDDHFDSDFEFVAYCIIFVTVAGFVWLIWDYVTTVKP